VGVENYCSTWNDFWFWLDCGVGSAGAWICSTWNNPSKRSEQKPNLVVETKQNDDRHHDGAEQYLYDVIVEDLLVGVWGVESLEFLRIETFAGYYVSGYYGVGGGCGLLCVRFHKNSLIETGIGPGSCTTKFMGSSLIY
jgi:hypothetical protein